MGERVWRMLVKEFIQVLRDPLMRAMIFAMPLIQLLMFGYSINTKIRLLMTSEDVIHNWAVPSLGVKLDTTPGRVNETWTLIRKEGRYRGQCSELCGVNHGFMPIVVHAVSKEAFAEWVKKAQEQFAKNDDSVSVARLKAR